MPWKSRIPPPEEKNGMGVELSKVAVIEKLSVHFMHGLTIKKACNAHNVKTNWMDYISPLTVSEWYTQFPAVSEYIDALRESGEVLSHKNWIDNIRAGNFQAAREWLKVKDKENYGDTADTGPKVIIEFAASPSPFITKTKEAVAVQVPPEFPQSDQYKKSQVKKKPKKSPGKKPSGMQASSSKISEKKQKSTTKGDTTPKKDSEKK